MRKEDAITDWNAYSRSFQSVMPSEMLRLNTEAAGWMSGRVADFGCGGGKIIPFVLDQSRVTNYTGIDMSADMVRRACWMAEQFPQKPSDIIHARIESVSMEPVDSAVSLNSYYTWPDSLSVLKHIFTQLKKNAVFVLATINPSIDMPRLLARAEMEMVGHPHWDEFKQHNMKICRSPDVNFVSMNELIMQAITVGFEVIEAHQHLYGGGLNFLVLERR